VAISLNNLGGVAEDQGDFVAARALHEESLGIRRKLGDKSGIASSLSHLGHVVNGLGEHAVARTLQDESLAIRRELGDRKGIATALNNLGNVATDFGDLMGAQALHEESLSIQRELGDRWGTSTTLSCLGGVACGQGRLLASRSFYRESLAIARELGDRWGAAETFAAWATSSSLQAHWIGRRATWGTAERLREDIAIAMSPTERRHYDTKGCGADARHWATPEFHRTWHHGRAMPLEEALDYALRGNDAQARAPLPGK
jgi:tetratricopeptide (TPR) repeat protein